ncbi:MAG: flagellar biosynthesis anti-sigma factor FlgM [Oscillospiraceae bacterium]|jgi:anti-sigma28 factor (negative regulator of flagellin synthesis)|nr:flagellar biosynthesis anti-sigma factor FlgM [Oscillospiraceae bacterium]
MAINNVGKSMNVNTIGKAAYAKVANELPPVVIRDKAKPADEIRISGQAFAQKELADEAKKITAELTSGREEYVNALKEQYNSGAYNTTSSDVANAILGLFA